MSSGGGGLGDVQVDALPYIDQEYDDPNLRDAVLSYDNHMTCIFYHVIHRPYN